MKGGPVVILLFLRRICNGKFGKNSRKDGKYGSS